MTFFGASFSWCFVERVADIKVWAGENPLAGIGGETGGATDGAVILGVGFVPHFQRGVFTLQVTKAAGLGGKLLQYRQQLAGMQGGQAGGQGFRVGFVVEPGKQGQLVCTDLNNAVAVAFFVPLVLVVFNTADSPLAIVLV